MGMDIGEQAVQVTLSVTQVTASAIKDIIQLLANREKNQDKFTHGQQSIKKLNLHGQQLESIEMSDGDIKALKKELNRHGVDFALVKDKETDTHTVYFKGQDVNRVYAGLKKCAANFQQASKRPMKDVMRDAEARAEQRNAKRASQEKERSADRGKESR